MFSRKLVYAIGALFFFALCIILITISSRQPSALEKAERVPISFFAPFQDIVTGTIHFTEDIWRHYFDLASAAKENDALKKSLFREVEKNNKCIETDLANQRLRSFFDFKKDTTNRVIASEVIGRDPSPWFKTVIVDKGESDAVEKGLAVVVAGGVVGQVMSASSNYAKVLLITDRNSSVDALIQGTRARGIIKGSSADKCSFQYVLRKNPVKVGDVVITSGLGGVYPKGIRLGNVSGVVRRNAGMFQEVEVTPYVDFEKLEEVMIVMKSPDTDASNQEAVKSRTSEK
jgi:rod shape-determining protein MreC